MMNKWPLVKLGKLCNIKTGRKDVRQGNPNGKYPFFTCAKKHTYSDSYSFDTEAILIAGNGDVGHTTYYKGRFEAYQRTYVLTDFNEVLPNYLFMVLEGCLQSELYDQRLGNTMPYIKKGMLTNFLVPLPTIPAQKRIVAILDEAFAGLETAVANTEKNLANARELYESYLNYSFNQNTEGWSKTTLGQVCTFQGGSQPPKSEFSKDKKDGYIRLIQIRDYKSDNHVVFIPEEKAKRRCNSTDVMIGRYGPPLFQILKGIDGAYNVALMKAIPKENEISKNFLYFFLQNPQIRNYVIHASNRAAGQAGVNKKTLEPYPFMYPNKQRQEEIVRSLENVAEDIKTLEFIYQQKLTALAELKQSLLQKAFSGELTANIDNAIEEVAA